MHNLNQQQQHRSVCLSFEYGDAQFKQQQQHRGVSLLFKYGHEQLKIFL